MKRFFSHVITIVVVLVTLTYIPVKSQNCIDLSNLNAPNITCMYGVFSTPYLHTGVLDYGPNNVASRHTVVTTNTTDPRTNNLLHTIPDNEPYSVRLGNWRTGAEAESIVYEFNVDTTNGAILLLKYAAVLENPGHTAIEQPRFRFEVLDANDQLVDAQCLSADFVASSALGWNTCNVGGTILWKDWTYVGADLTAYHGQSVRIRLTTYDCDQGGHYGYAYFTLNCRKKSKWRPAAMLPRFLILLRMVLTMIGITRMFLALAFRQIKLLRYLCKIMPETCAARFRLQLAIVVILY